MIQPSTYGHELCVVTKRMRLRVQAAKMSFYSNMAGLGAVFRQSEGAWKRAAATSHQMESVEVVPVSD